MIYLVSGKRAVGKDTFCAVFNEILMKLVGSVKVVALADAPKKEFCNECELVLNRFMTDRSYKEIYRKQFITYTEMAKKNDKYIWCKKAMEGCEGFDNVIISDIRYPVELEFFIEFFKSQIVTIRITADDDVRIERGWKFDLEIDRHMSEIGLDGTDFDYTIDNNNNDGIDFLYKTILDLKIINDNNVTGI